jgi:C-terminal processing protease CtpA/Prc
VVRAVDAGGAAAQGGVEVGDELVAVRGGPGSGMPATAVQVTL